MNVTIKRGPGENILLANIYTLELYEVVDDGTSPELYVGTILFRSGDDYYVFTSKGVDEFCFEDDDLESVRVREFKPGDSFTITFEEED